MYTISSKLEEWLKNYNRKLREQKEELLLNAAGYNTKGHQVNWWLRNRFYLGMWAFLIISWVACYAYGFLMVTRILTIVIGLMGLSIIWKGIKKLYNIIRMSLRAKKLLKQTTHLKR